MILRLIIVFGAGIAILAGLVLFLSSRDHEKAVKTVAALEWTQGPKAHEDARLPGDRVAVGRIENTGPEPIAADAEDFEVRDSAGEEQFATLQFIDVVHARPRAGEKKLQLGVELELEPGETAPLTVRYRLDRRAVPPAAVYFKEVRALELPPERSDGGG